MLLGEHIAHLALAASRLEGLIALGVAALLVLALASGRRPRKRPRDHQPGGRFVPD